VWRRGARVHDSRRLAGATWTQTGNVPQEDAAVDLLNARAAAEGHRQLEFFLDDLERLGHAGLAHRAQAIGRRAAM